MKNDLPGNWLAYWAFSSRAKTPSTFLKLYFVSDWSDSNPRAVITLSAWVTRINLSE